MEPTRQSAALLAGFIDKASWALGDKPPQRAWRMGGRQTCLVPRFGDQFDRRAVVFEYDDGVRVFGFTRDQEDCHTETSDLIIGTKGRCDVLKHTIEGQSRWRYEGARANMYDVEHQALFDGIRAGKPANNQPRPVAVVLGRPPRGAVYVRLPPLGAWSWSGPGILPGTGRGFSVDNEFQAYPLSCECLPKP
jgi:hypothetical protein